MILLVDDNRVGREGLAKILRLHGHEVVEAGGASEGLALLNNTRFDLIITDFVMPEVSGFEVADQLRTHQKTANVPIIVHTGVPLTEQDRQRLAYQLLTITSKLDRASLQDRLRELGRGEEATVYECGQENINN